MIDIRGVNRMVENFAFRDLLLKHLNPNSAVLLSFDVDRTLADLSIGSHFVHPRLKELFLETTQCKGIHVALNTGRDKTTCAPVSRTLKHVGSCVFLSGRVITGENFRHVEKGAILPNNILDEAWRKFVDSSVLFLDVKHADGAMFFVKGSRQAQELYGHKKKRDWFENMAMSFVDLDLVGEDMAGKVFRSLDILRIEIPILGEDNPRLLEAINSKDLEKIKPLASELFPSLAQDDQAMTLACPANLEYENLRPQIGSIQVVRSTSGINKGTGLKHLADRIGVPYQNVIHFGDRVGTSSSNHFDNDIIIKGVMPRALAVAVTDAISVAGVDFVCNQREGLNAALECLINVCSSL